MGDYPGRKQVRNRVKRATKNDRIIAQRADEKATAAAATTATVEASESKSAQK